jgi:hypothetical protein
MKAAYVNRPPLQHAAISVYLALVLPNNFSYAQSQEARQVCEAAERVQQHWNKRAEALIADVQSTEDFSYNRLSLRPVSSVKCQYKYIDRMHPRQFPLDE